jgi:hypothetical protein
VQKKRSLYAVAGLLCAALPATLLIGLYWACQNAPEFYSEALNQKNVQVRQASDALLREAAAFASDVRKPGHWQALFTAEQINGWLAYDMLQNHPHLLPPGISNLRLAIDRDRAQIAFKWTKPAWSSIVSLETEIYLREENVVAIRICKARAGLLPLPLGGLLHDLLAAAEEIGLPVDQQQVDGDPLLIISLAAIQPKDKVLCLESLELSNGEIYLAGHSDRESPGGQVAVTPDGPRATAAAAQAEKTNIQR